MMSATKQPAKDCGACINLDTWVLKLLTAKKIKVARLYFLNAKAAQALANSKNIPEKAIAIGAPNIKHQEYLLRLAQLPFAWQQTAKKKNG